MDVLGLIDIPMWLILVTFLLITAYFYLTWNFGFWKSQGIPGPRPLPIFGNSHLLFLKPFPVMDMEIVSKYGKTVGVYTGRKPVLLTTDPEIIKHIFVKEAELFANRQRFETGDPSVDSMLSVLRDDHWKHVRNLLTPTFSSGKLKMMSDQINKNAKTLATNIEKVDGEPVEVKECAGGYSMDLIASTAFGLEIDSQNNPKDPFVLMAKKAMNQGLFRPIVFIILFLPFLLPLMRKMKTSMFIAKDIKNFFHDILLRTMEARKEGNTKQVDFLQLMMDNYNETGFTESTEEGTKKERKGMTKDEILAQGLLFFLAAYETTSSAISFLCYLLALNPDVQEKAYKHIVEKMGDKEYISVKDLGNLPYIEMCVKESLRMYSPAPRIERVASRATEVKGIQIPKDGIISVPIQFAHYDPDVWAEPNKFRPERFSAEEKTEEQNLAYLPFGYGPRNCIGMRLALQEINIAIIYLLRRFHIKTCEKTEIPLKFNKGGLTKAANGVWLKFEKREEEPSNSD